MEGEVVVLVDAGVSVLVVSLVWWGGAVLVGQSLPLLEALVEGVVIGAGLGQQRLLPGGHGVFDTWVGVNCGDGAHVIGADGALTVCVPYVGQGRCGFGHSGAGCGFAVGESGDVADHGFGRRVAVGEVPSVVIDFCEDFDG